MYAITQSNHLFEIVRINIGSQDSILLQPSGHHIFKEVWTNQHTGDFKKFSLVAEKQEEAPMTWLLEIKLVFWMTF